MKKKVTALCISTLIGVGLILALGGCASPTSSDTNNETSQDRFEAASLPASEGENPFEGKVLYGGSSSSLGRELRYEFQTKTVILSELNWDTGDYEVEETYEYGVNAAAQRLSFREANWLADEVAYIEGARTSVSQALSASTWVEVVEAISNGEASPTTETEARAMVKSYLVSQLYYSVEDAGDQMKDWTPSEFAKAFFTDPINTWRSDYLEVLHDDQAMAQEVWDASLTSIQSFEYTTYSTGASPIADMPNVQILSLQGPYDTSKRWYEQLEGEFETSDWVSDFETCGDRWLGIDASLTDGGKYEGYLELNSTETLLSGLLGYRDAEGQPSRRQVSFPCSVAGTGKNTKVTVTIEGTDFVFLWRPQTEL